MVFNLNTSITGIWKTLQKEVEKWTQTFGNVNVITGPVFDWNHDGLPDQFNNSQ